MSTLHPSRGSNRLWAVLLILLARRSLQDIYSGDGTSGEVGHPPICPAGRTQPFPEISSGVWILRFGPMDSGNLSYSVWESTVQLKPHYVWTNASMHAFIHSFNSC